MYEVVSNELWATVVFVPLTWNQPDVAEVQSELRAASLDRLQRAARAIIESTGLGERSTARVPETASFEGDAVETKQRTR